MSALSERGPEMPDVLEHVGLSITVKRPRSHVTPVSHCKSIRVKTHFINDLSLDSHSPTGVLFHIKTPFPPKVLIPTGFSTKTNQRKIYTLFFRL